MIELEKISNETLKEMLLKVKERIAVLAPEWTYHEESDPGITLLELFAWLADVQREYLGNISTIINIKLLKLLGINLKRNRGSRTFLQVLLVEKDVAVPDRTKWLADKLVFENVGRKFLASAQIMSVKFDNSESNDSETEYYNFNGTHKFYVFGTNIKRRNAFYISFDKPLPKGEKTSVYFEIFLKKELKRNPPDENFKPMAKIKWEYYGKKGWQSLKVLDFTYGFLFSGIITIELDDEMLEYGDGLFKIRAVVLSEDYDMPPSITKILLNVFEVEQKDTHCENIIFKKSDIVCKKIKNGKTFEHIEKKVIFRTHLSLYGENVVYIKQNGGWIVKREGFEILKDVINGETIVIFDDVDFIKKLKPEDEAVMLVSYSEYIKPKIVIGNGKGYSPQLFYTSFGATPVYEDFKIMVGEKRGEDVVFNFWERKDDFFESFANSRHFVFDEKTETIVFGDYVHASVPRYLENNILIGSISFTSQELSNVKAGVIKKVESENETLKNVMVKQITKAKGGRKNETFEDIKKHGINLFFEKKRAVTVDDYEKIVSETPGLIFKNISILPGCLKDQKGITIAVRCEEYNDLPKSCAKNIISHIEKYRLLNTRIEIIGPEYVEINISAKIYVNLKFKRENMEVENKIKKFFSKLNKKMGTPFNFGELYGEIEKLESVSFVDYFKINPIGIHPNLINESDGIIPPKNAVYILKKIDANYVSDTDL